MPCDPNDNTLNPPNLGPPPAIPGFGIPITLPGIPLPDNIIPEGIPEDIINLVNSLLTPWPGGALNVNPGNFTKDVWDGLASLLNQIAPFLALYSFFLAALNMILCIIDVICALTNPFKLPGAVRRLFKKCIPAFISLFPWLALLAMILALLLLLLAIIEYIINRFLEYIRDIIDNVIKLGQAVQLNDENSVIAITTKISGLLCLLEQLFAVLIAFQSIFAVIQALFNISGRSVCASGGNRQGDDNNCCTPDVCPPFISEQPDGFISSTGSLLYLKERTDNLTGNLIRPESYQFRDTDTTNAFKFIDIVTPIDGFTFWPDGVTFNRNSNVRKIPYVLDMNVNVDPQAFGFSNSTGEKINFEINDIVVTEAPTTVLKKFDDSITQNFFFQALKGSDFGSGTDSTGVLNLQGGKVFEIVNETHTVQISSGKPIVTVNNELSKVIGVLNSVGNNVWNENGSFSGNTLTLPAETMLEAGDSVVVNYTTPYSPNGTQLTLETFIKLPSQAGPISGNDGYELNLLNYNLRINHESLLSYSLITVMCIPDLQVEANLFATLSPIDSVEAQIGALPDIGGTIACMSSALQEFRQNVSTETAVEFQAKMEACLNGLKEDAESAYVNTLTAGVSQFDSTIELNPDVQFVELPIEVKVQLKDSNGVVLSKNVPQSLAEQIADKLIANVNLGSVSEFGYDGYDSFTADIISDRAGKGVLTVLFDNNSLSEVLNRDDENVSTSVRVRELEYEFVGFPADSGNKERRNEIDISNTNRGTS